MAGSRTTRRPSDKVILDTIDWLLDVVGPELRADREARAIAEQRQCDDYRQPEAVET